MNAYTSEPNDLTLILGGTRSGKSAYAEQRVRAYGAASPTQPCGVLYVATAQARADDPAMLDRIQRHRERRPAQWKTLECPLQLAKNLAESVAPESTSTASRPAIVMVDCVTLWVSNILFSLPNPEDTRAFEDRILAEITALTDLVARSACRWVLVSGETGLGLVAPTAIGRLYCDGLGLANQLLAASAREVMLVVAGRALSLPAL